MEFVMPTIKHISVKDIEAYIVANAASCANYFAIVCDGGFKG